MAIRLLVTIRANLLLQIEPLAEALHLSGRVDDSLSTRVERVAVRANIDAKIGARRTSLERRSARAGDGCFDVLGMNTLLHS
jgi:hypothetical protein